MRTRNIWGLMPLVLSLFAGPSHAQGKETGFLIGTRAAYALPFGTLTGEPDSYWLYDLYSAVVPFLLEGEYRIWPGFAVGGYAQYAVAQLRGECPREITCSGSNIRFGLEVLFYPKSEMDVRLWWGVGSGFERTDFAVSVLPAVFEVAYWGFDGCLQAGFDYPLTKSVRGGLYGTLTAGRFFFLDATRGSLQGSSDLSQPLAAFLVPHRGEAHLRCGR